MMRIAGGTVLTDSGWLNVDVEMDGPVVTDVGNESRVESNVIDARGMLVGPGFVDLHVHLRDPGQTWKEDIATGTAAAAAGGFTAVFAMPNTDPACDRVGVVEMIEDRAAQHATVDVLLAGAMTVNRHGKEMAPIADMYRAGVRMFTDDGDARADTTLTTEIMKTVASLEDAFISQHAELADMTADGHMHEGDISRSLGIAGLPREAEVEMVKRDLELVAETGVRYHCQHVSAAETVSLIRQAKRNGLDVTAEVTPHHLFFDVTAVAGLDPNYKMYPPLREPEDRLALVEGLAEGVIDAVATDHAPHTDAEKGAGFATAPRGVVGLETAAAVVWTLYGDRDLLFRALSTKPAVIGRLAAHGQPLRPGSPANVVVFDPGGSGGGRPTRSKSSNNPFQGHPLKGEVVATIREGELVYMRSST